MLSMLYYPRCPPCRLQVRTKAWGLLRQFPVKDCSRPVAEYGASGGGGGGPYPGMHSAATGSSRGSRATRAGPQVR
jgi:hypothetical protein